mmetsp:Transcript_6414/g.19030  ORF Transcript_6414/g.19030 Transcript_6414/m.19030 type:complete len:248 (-) Transcript_6414:505-1248(-)
MSSKATRAASASWKLADVDRSLSRGTTSTSTRSFPAMLRPLNEATCATPGTASTAKRRRSSASWSTASLNSCSAPAVIWKPVAASIAATARPAAASAWRKILSEHRAAAIPTSATTDDSASDRWCHAFASRTGDRRRLPTRAVARKRPSLATMDTSAATRAILPGLRPSAPCACTPASSACDAAPAPAATSMPPTTSAPTVSKRPWPYGWSSSAGNLAARMATNVTTSLARSEAEWAASEIIAADRP